MRAITYYLSCKKDTRKIDPKVVKTKTNKRVMLSKCYICNNKKVYIYFTRIWFVR